MDSLSHKNIQHTIRYRHSRRHDLGTSSETRRPAPDPCVKIEGWAAQPPCGHRAHQEYEPLLTTSCRIREAPSLPGCGCRASQDFRGAQGTSSSLDYQRMFLDSYRTLKGTRTSLESFFCQNLASVKLMSVCSEMLHDKRRVLQRGATWKALLQSDHTAAGIAGCGLYHTNRRTRQLSIVCMETPWV